MRWDTAEVGFRVRGLWVIVVMYLMASPPFFLLLF